VRPHVVGLQEELQLLRESDHSVQEVATRVGYESEAAFNRAFKRVAGAPPAAWRKRVRGVNQHPEPRGGGRQIG
jgi:AraC-like DNA-binding protein